MWCDTCQKAFQELKALLTSAPVLAAPDFNAPFKLVVDTSDVAAGAVFFYRKIKMEWIILFAIS